MEASLKAMAVAAIAISTVSASLKPGACPARDQNKSLESFDRYSMAGLWYEYVWDSSFAQDLAYKCSTWIVLSDEADKGPGQYVVYNNMVSHSWERNDEMSEDEEEEDEKEEDSDDEDEDSDDERESWFINSTL